MTTTWKGAGALQGLARSRRARTSIACNAISSVGNLALAVSLARTVSLHEFGSFAVAWSAYLLATGCLRSAVAESVIATGRADLVSRALRSTVQLGGLISLLGVLVGLFIDSKYLVAVGASLWGLCLFDAVRNLSLTLGSTRLALAQDCAWTVVTLGAAAGSVAGWVDGWFVLLVWCASAGLLSLASAARLARGLRADKAPDQTARIIMPLYALDYLLGSGSMQVTVNVLAATTSPVVVGGLRAAGTALSPMTLVTTSARPLLISLVARFRRHSPASEFLSSMLVALTLAVAILPLIGIAVLVPDRIGVQILGASWASAHRVLVPVGLEAVFALVTTVAFAAHRAHQAALRTVVTRGAIACIRLVLIVAAASQWGLPGAAWGMATVAILGTFVWWTSYWRLYRASAEAEVTAAGGKHARRRHRPR